MNRSRKNRVILFIAPGILMIVIFAGVACNTNISKANLNSPEEKTLPEPGRELIKTFDAYSAAVLGKTGILCAEVCRDRVLLRLRYKDEGYRYLSLLDLAAMHGNTETVRMLIKKGADVNNSNVYGTTALHRAAGKGRMKTAAALIACGADINACHPENQWKPLHWAVNGGHQKTALFLVEHGAEIDLYSAAGLGMEESIPQMLEQRSEQNKQYHWSATHALRPAVRNGHWDIVRTLIHAGADINALYNGQETLLKEAVWQVDYETVEKLLDAGAVPDLPADSEDAYGSAIHRAAVKDSIRIARLLLKKGAKIDSINNRKEQPLQFAADRGSVKIAALLIKQGADVNARSKYNYTPLMSAASKGHTDAAAMLLASGADPNQKNLYNNNALCTAAENGNPEPVRLLLGFGADVNTENGNTCTPLLLALQMQRSEKLKKYRETVNVLLKAGADINKRDTNGRSVLHECAARNNIPMIEEFLRRGMDVNIRNNAGFTPLHFAVLLNSVDAAKALIRHGADIEAKNNNGRTPVQCGAFLYSKKGEHGCIKLLCSKGAHMGILAAAVLGETAKVRAVLDRDPSQLNKKNGYQYSLLVIACIQGDVPTAELLINRGIDIDTRSILKETPLHFAAGEGHSRIAALLIKSGADVNAVQMDGITPLGAASSAGYTGAASLLIQHGADINHRDKSGRTPLHRASGHGHRSTSELLLKSGVDVNARDRRDRTPLDHAYDNNRNNILELLIRAGGKTKYITHGCPQ